MVAERNEWAHYLENNWEDLLAALGVHTTLTLQAIAIALLIAFPLAVAAHYFPRSAAPILNVSGAMYTIPSLALFAVLAPYTGIGRVTVLIGLVMYALLVLVRNILVGLQGVDADVVDAARGLGYSRLALLLRVELPNALPAIVAGLRLATVTTVALVTVGVVVGYGGLGQLMFRGFYSAYTQEIAISSLLCVLLALAFDLVLMLAGRALTPWTRTRAA